MESKGYYSQNEKIEKSEMMGQKLVNEIGQGGPCEMEARLMKAGYPSSGVLCETKAEATPARKPTEEERVVFLLLTRRLIEESVHDTPHGVVIGLHCAIPDFFVRKQLADELIARFK